MQLLEVKNDIAKIIYNPTENHLLPSDFLLIEDANQKVVAQIINTETIADSNNCLAILRLSLAIDNDDNIALYNGYIPAKTSRIIYIHSDEIMELIKGSGMNIYFGNLSNHPSCYVKPSISFLNDNLYIQSDRPNQTEIIINNIISELKNKKQNVLLLDFNGKYNNLEDAVRIKITEDFKLPLNIDAFNTILEYETSDCSLDDKTLIQSIILELREYIQTLPDKYLPFTLFKQVVNNEFISSPSYGLMYFRNKLWQYAQDNIFAENNEDFDVIDSLFPKSNIVVVDASLMDPKWYQFVVQTILSMVQKTCYFIFSLNDVRMDKKSIIGMYNKPNIIPVVSTSYESYYTPILKSVCRNQILCKPSNYYEEKDTYAVLLNRMNADEMVLYGESTLYLTLPVDLKEFTPSTPDDLVVQEIKKDVDKLLSSSHTVIPPEAVVQHLVPTATISNYEIVEDDELTDSDLDFLDEALNEANASAVNVVENSSSETSEDETKYEMFSPVEEESNQAESEEVELLEQDENISSELESDITVDNEEVVPESDDEITPIDDVINGITERFEETGTIDSVQQNDETPDDADNDEDVQVQPEVEEEQEQEVPVVNENINLKKPVELPLYETDLTQEIAKDELPFKIGDYVYHPKHGKGVIEGFANYSNKILFCQIEFENVGRRILDPRIAGIEKIS